MFDKNIDTVIRGKVNTVLEHLNSISTLPNEGILAGASLASLLWASYIGKPFSEIVTNDIDIFYLTKVEEIAFEDIKPYHDWNIITTKKVSKTKEPTDTSYIRHYMERHLQRYMKIENAERDGLLNKVYYSANSSNPALLISSFDINVTMAAYDLSKKVLYYNEHYLDFLINSKLKIINFHTPYQTLIRTYEKCSQLGLTYDIKPDLEIFAIFSAHKVKNARTKFGIKYRNLYYNHQEELGKIFELDYAQNSLTSKTPIWSLHLKQGLTRKYVSKNTYNMGDVSDINFYVKHIRNVPEYTNIWQYIRSVWVQQGTQFIEGMSLAEVASMKTFKAIEFLDTFMSENNTLYLIFGRTPLRQLIQVAEWFQEELDPLSMLLLKVLCEGDFNEIHTKEEFSYYVSVLLIANRVRLAKLKERVLNENTVPVSDDLPF